MKKTILLTGLVFAFTSVLAPLQAGAAAASVVCGETGYTRIGTGSDPGLGVSFAVYTKPLSGDRYKFCFKVTRTTATTRIRSTVFDLSGGSYETNVAEANEVSVWAENARPNGSKNCAKITVADRGSSYYGHNGATPSQCAAV